MSNFQFLKQQFPKIHQSASRAEEYVNRDPRSACFQARFTLERVLHWLYQNDNRYRHPYETKLSALIFGDSFQRYAPHAIKQKADMIRRVGNTAVHGNQPIPRDKALHLVQELFQITYWLTRTYGTKASRATLPQQFDEAHLPPSMATLKKHTSAMLKALQAKFETDLEEQEQARQQQLTENEALRAQLQALQAQVEQQRLSNEQEPDPHNYTPNEAQTRQLYIDVLLAEAGWQVGQTRQQNPGGVSVEYPVVGMPNTRGKGNADYVLWGDNGKPLAVIEAKRTSKEARQGKRQAKLYADCLEEMHGQRPLIFYSNGYETTLWDDSQNYPPRPVQGFYTQDELTRLIQRRDQQKRLDEVATDKAIVDREYQEAAIRHLTAQWDKNRREALLVMATGTGKTRTAIAMVDILMRANWVKRVLFLADRTSLVRQAVKNFKKHLPSSSPVNLLEEKEAFESRVVVSTYHTMLNKIEATNETGQKLFGIGHFDLVIIDEAHRSVYRKFGAIFTYFDSLLLGLTATPKDEVDRNTYNLFNLETGVPTYAYELAEAVADEYLVPPNPVSVPTQFTREGIRYHELSDAEQEEWELLEWGDSDSMPDTISAGDLNKWLFNQSTVDEVLKNLMQNGIKVAGGDKLGKTILFARNKKHADFIVKRFDALYPEYGGTFAAMIVSGESYTFTLIDDFSEANKRPQIAVSVDMLDTGIDVPDVVNLVFFKPIRSKTKFFQMIGRGTRLSEGLFGPDQHKTHFNIFDHCQNFEFFDHHPDGVKASKVVPLSQRVFQHRVDLLSQLQTISQPDPDTADMTQQLRQTLHEQVASMPIDNVQVRARRAYVDKYTHRSAWDTLSQTDLIDIKNHLSDLPTGLTQEDETAKRFDNLLLQMQVAWLAKAPVFEALQGRVMEMAEKLEVLHTIPMVNAQLGLILQLQDEDYWAGISLKKLEQIRVGLRGLIQFIPKRSNTILYTNFTDTLDVAEVKPVPLVSAINQTQYKKKIQQFIRQNEDVAALFKIRHAIPLDGKDLQDLEAFFYGADVVGGREAFEKACGKQENLALFIRRLVGLNRKAARERFAQYLDNKVFTAEQITFVSYIIDQLTQTGVLDVGQLYERPFTDLHSQGLAGVFGMGETAEALVGLVKEVNRV